MAKPEKSSKEKKPAKGSKESSSDVKDPLNLSPEEWLRRIKRSLRYRDGVKKEQQWERLLKEYKGKYEIKLNGIAAPPINLVFGYVDTTKARIYFRDPHISVNPRGAESIGASKVVE